MRALRLDCLLAAFALALLCLLTSGPLAGSADAEVPQWRLQQPTPPEAPAGVVGSETPVGLGRVGDVEFWAPNRGLLITDGNGGADGTESTVPAGVWAYNGQRWHELAKVCGASDGRIAWAAENEFWTVSNGRPGQAARGEVLPPLEDDTLCRFAFNQETEKLEVVDSYAHLAFQSNEYRPMDAAACISSTDCWFAGAPLPAPQIGAFHLHWNGSSLQAEPNTRVYSVSAMSVFEGKLWESIGLPLEEAEGEEQGEEILHPSILQEISPEGSAQPFERLHPVRLAEEEEEGIRESVEDPLPEYARGSYPQALGGLQLSVTENSLWAAAGPVERPPSSSNPGVLTILHEAEGEWSQVLGPAETGLENQPRPSGSLAVDPPALEDDVVNSIAAEPGTSSAWLALDTQVDSGHPSATALATVVHVEADGQLTEEQLPSEAERKAGISPKGAAYRVVCPAQNDCWMATTQGWLFHLSDAANASLPADTDPAFDGALIEHRPLDEGVPQEQSDEVPVDDSGLEESQPTGSASSLPKPKVNTFATITLPLLSDEHSRLIHGSTLQVSFHLAVKARVRLIAKRHKRVVASTATRTLKAGKRSLELRLNVHAWPTKLAFQTKALAPLPTTTTRSAGVESVSTSLAFPKALGITGWEASL